MTFHVNCLLGRQFTCNVVLFSQKTNCIKVSVVVVISVLRLNFYKTTNPEILLNSLEHNLYKLHVFNLI